MVSFISGCILAGAITSGIWYYFVLKDEKINANEIPGSLNKVNSKSVYLFGEPSTGKSTLVNRLTGSDFATGEAFGITTGVGVASANFDGKKINFFDTPGIHDNSSFEEKTGIKSGKKLLPQADVILTMFDISRVHEEKSKKEILESVKAAKALNEEAKVFFVLTRLDKIKDSKAREEAVDNTKKFFSDECKSLGGEFLVVDGYDEASVEKLKSKVLSTQK